MTEKLDLSKVIATVDGKEIAERDVETLKQLMGEQGAQFDTEAGRDRLRDELVNQELLYLDAVERGLDSDPEFLKQLENSKRQMLQQFALRKLLESVTVDEDELRAYYDAHKDRLSEKYAFNASHILVETEETAKALKAELDEGASFEDLAVKHSSCPSKSQGGSLGNFQTGQMVPEFEAVLTKMAEGDISAPVQTQFGFHLIRLNNKQLIQGTDYDSARPQLYNEFMVLQQQAAYVNQLKEIEKRHDVVKSYGQRWNGDKG